MNQTEVRQTSVNNMPNAAEGGEKNKNKIPQTFGLFGIFLCVKKGAAARREALEMS